MDISVVIPTYNSELIIDELISKIIFKNELSFEIIVVNDFSDDNTYQKLINLQKKNHNLKIVNLKTNIGQVGATLCGLTLASGNLIVTMDDDLQHNPKYIEDLITEINKSNCDIVVAKWGLDETLTRNLGSYFFSVISSLLVFKSINFRNTAFRAIKKECKQEFINFFLSRYWIDPRRLNFKVSQILIPHSNQTFRPYSSFKSRLKLALKHLVFDSYLVHLLIILYILNNVFLTGFFIVSFTLIQYSIRSLLYKKRKKVLVSKKY